MRFITLVLFVTFSHWVAAKPNITFHNDLAINAHTFLINLASESRELPGELQNNEIAINALNSYSAMVNEPKFHLLFSNNDIAHITSILMASKSVNHESCPKLCEKLAAFIPVYEKTVWKLIQEKNRQWIVSTNKLLEQYGDTIEQQLDNYFDMPLIPTTHIVYVVENIDKGATTSGRNPVSIMSSSNSQYQEFNALEMIFHEVAHTYATSRKSVLSKKLQKVFQDQKTSAPRDFWHVVHFYTVGDVVAEVLKEANIEYSPYAHSYGLYDGRWSESVKVIEEYWTQYLENKITMEEGLLSMRNKLATE